MTKDALIDALKRLDPKNDEHWVASGQPNLKCLETLLGEKVTRAQIDKVANGFTRENTEIKSLEKVDKLPEEKSQGFVNEKDALKAKLQELRNERAKIDRQIIQETNKLDAIITAENSDTTSQAEVIKQFQKSQQEQRASQNTLAKTVAAQVTEAMLNRKV